MQPSYTTWVRELLRMRSSSPFTLSAVEVNHYCFFLLDSSLYLLLVYKCL